MASFFLSTVNISSFYWPGCALVCSTGPALQRATVTEISVAFLCTRTKQCNILTLYIWPPNMNRDTFLFLFLPVPFRDGI